jgi:HopJ type III effector protein
MKFSVVASIALVSAPVTSAFATIPFGAARASTCLNAEIRKPSEKAQNLRWGWDGTTALGGAVEKAAPARMLDQIRAAGETIPPDCEVFNSNVEMSADDLKMEEVIEIIDMYYETGLIEWKNGDLVNKQGENEGSAKLLSYAALSEMDKETTLKVSAVKDRLYLT